MNTSYLILLFLPFLGMAHMVDEYSNQGDLLRLIATSALLIAWSIIYAALIVKNKTDK